MKLAKRIISIVIIIALLITICMASTVSYSASGTGTGLAEWALNAYYSKWSYVYGGASAGEVDCSGLIYSYAGGYRVGDAQMGNSSYTGYVSNGIPNIHGLGLYQPGHVGIYVGNSMAVDARGDEYGVCYESAYSHNWTIYFKVPGVSYPSTGWEEFNGDYYYYENGQYLSDTTRTIDGVTYTFASSGISTQTPGDTGSKANSSSSASSSSSSSGSLRNGSKGEAVEKLQQRLYELGYYNGAVDGIFGDQTEKAFKLFQNSVGLYVDGIAGSDVEYLYANDAPSYSANELEIAEKEKTELAQTGITNEEENTSQDSEEETYQKGDYDEKIMEIQTKLSELGYYEGSADGSFGSMTEEAVKIFQGANGITQTGIADAFTLQMLFSDNAAKNPLENITEETKTVEPTASVAAGISSAEPSGTEIELQTNELSSKALAGIANDLGFESDSNGNNFEFILWLAIMIVVMLATFSIVYSIEKKKSGKKASHRYF